MKEDVLRIPKYLIHEAPDDFWPSYYRSKSERGGKSENVTEIMRRLKKGTATILEFWLNIESALEKPTFCSPDSTWRRDFGNCSSLIFSTL